MVAGSGASDRPPAAINLCLPPPFLPAIVTENNRRTALVVPPVGH
jgi:hypothetical protein